jgi:OmpA-OmpF porin, OOP family
MRLQILSLLILACLHNQGQPQARSAYKNLVPNSSFENYRKRSSDIRKAIPWQSIETIDYYQQPLSNDTTVDRGAYTGSCYAGFRFRKKYKEFLQVRLVEPLHRGTIYEFNMQVRLAFWSNAMLRSFGVLFSKGGYRGAGDVSKGSMIDTVCLTGGLINHYRWLTVKGFYKADGGEKFITIGNFSPVIQKDMARIDITRFGPREAYYFIDEVRLVKARQFEEKVAIERIGPDYAAAWEEDSALKVREDIRVGETVGLNNIFFDENRHYLLPESYQELNKLSYYLLRHPDLEISINGYSDDAPFAFLNERLSELRAREVFEYLIRKGVQNKMYFKGYGEEKSVSTDANSTAATQRLNRRVEFEIVKK